MEHRDRAGRPDTLAGATQRIEAPHGKVYVNINVDDDGDPFEVFITTGSSGGFTNAMCEALAKSISNALRSGTRPQVIADDLMGIRGPSTPAVDCGDDIYSVPDAVGVAMQRFIEEAEGESIRGSGEDAQGVED